MVQHAAPLPADYRQVVVTGGPGAGKTAILEVVQKQFCKHVLVLPEAASILFSGGFPRAGDASAKRAAQRAIYAIQTELEHFAQTRDTVGLVLCDRGTVDGAAYWPGEIADFWPALGTESKQEMLRYAAVIHLHTPTAGNGYNHSNRVRIETAEEAALIDARIALAWRDHPRRFEVPASTDFLAKTQRTLEIVESLLPTCCRQA